MAWCYSLDRASWSASTPRWAPIYWSSWVILGCISLVQVIPWKNETNEILGNQYNSSLHEIDTKWRTFFMTLCCLLKTGRRCLRRTLLDIGSIQVRPINLGLGYQLVTVWKIESWYKIKPNQIKSNINILIGLYYSSIWFFQVTKISDHFVLSLS